jgi:hypothetical protein
MKKWKRVLAVLLSVCALGLCAACDNNSSESDEKHEHVWISTNVKGETCTEKGLNIKRCDVCGEEIEEEIPASHTLEKVDEEPATCEDVGVVYYICRFCDYEKEETTPKLGHNFVGGVCRNEGCAELEIP